MTTDKLYKHKKNVDVAFNPTHIETGNLGLYVEGAWYNIASGVPKYLMTDVIVIRNEQLPDWELYEEQ